MKLYTKKIVGEIFSKVKGGSPTKWGVRGPMTIVHGYIYQTLSSVLSHPTRRAGEPVGALNAVLRSIDLCPKYLTRPDLNAMLIDPGGSGSSLVSGRDKIKLK